MNITPTPQGNVSFIFDWEPERSPCIQKEYLVEYELSNFDQCDTQTAGSFKKAGTVVESEFSIEGLEYYSTYVFYVTTVHNGTHKGERSVGITVSTGETGIVLFFCGNILRLQNMHFWLNIPKIFLKGRSFTMWFLSTRITYKCQLLCDHVWKLSNISEALQHECTFDLKFHIIILFTTQHTYICLKNLKKTHTQKTNKQTKKTKQNKTNKQTNKQTKTVEYALTHVLWYAMKTRQSWRQGDLDT